MDGFIQFAKSILKIGVTGFIAYMVLKPHVGEVRNLVGMDPARSSRDDEAVQVAAASGRPVPGRDRRLRLVLQRQRFMSRMRMTLQEIKEEFKQSTATRISRASVKQLQMQRSRQRMMQAVPKATVVVMNPTHYAVALKYEAGETPAPMCVAKGVDELALRYAPSPRSMASRCWRIRPWPAPSTLASRLTRKSPSNTSKPWPRSSASS
jgi:flagellar biosynthetic protein FlhB